MSEDFEQGRAAQDAEANGMDDRMAAVSDAAPDATSKTPKKKHRGGIIAGVVVIVLVLAGVGLWTWHEQPTFCNAVCHIPMDTYVETYYAQAEGSATDKWGNTVTDTSAMMVCTHADAGVTCLDCHVPSMQQQISEVGETISGDYDYPLEEQSITYLLTNSGRTGNSDTMCLTEGCHDLTREDLTELTADMPRNPHSWQHGEIECDTCHKSHRASVLQCTQCHEDAEEELPDGWVDWTQSQAYKAEAYSSQEQVSEQE